MNVLPFSHNWRTGVTDKKVMLIHNCMDLQDIDGSSSETWPTSQDANEIISIKVEDVSKVESVLHLEEEVDDAVKLRFSGIKTEHEVSCMSVFHC